MRDRGAVVIIEQQRAALIRREKEGRIYYVFPGGKQEDGETIEQCAKREAFEELGVHVEVGELIMQVPYNGTQHYFRAKITDGQFGTGQGEEFLDINSSYEAVWISLEDFDRLHIIPEQLAHYLNENKK